MKIFSHGFLWENLTIVRRNSPEGHHLYLLNTMKPINLPPSLSAGHATIVPLLLYVIYGRKFSENFRGFDIANRCDELKRYIINDNGTLLII